MGPGPVSVYSSPVKLAVPKATAGACDRAARELSVGFGASVTISVRACKRVVGVAPTLRMVREQAINSTITTAAPKRMQALLIPLYQLLFRAMNMWTSQPTD